MAKKNPVEIDHDMLQIDPERLDHEWLRQARLVMQLSEQNADARRKLDAAKNYMELQKAEVSRDVRADPTAYNVDKVTEASVAAAVTESKEYQAAYKSMLAYRHSVDVIGGALNALEHKKRALESLVGLWRGQYFAEPAADADDAEAVDMIKKKGARRRRRRATGDDE
jgi:hypothetical protein